MDGFSPFQLPVPLPRTLADNALQAREVGTAKAAKEFEGMFFGQMFEQLWSSVPVDPDFGGGSGEEMFRGLLIQEFGKAATARGGFGLAAEVQAALLKAQESLP